jgi:ClpP class serine protease
MPQTTPKNRQTFTRVLQEAHQDHATRRQLYSELETALGGKKVVSLFTSFRWPVLLEDTDADMLEEVLHNVDLSKQELVLLINSPGGDAFAAERIVNICRSFSPKGFSVIVPKMAKSAATMVCLGAKEIGMSKTSELGPVDPQIAVQDGDSVRYLAAHEIVESYNELMNRANRTRGRLEPYLQQLARFDARDIRRIQSAQELSASIAVKVLHTGVLSKLTERQIKAKIQAFLDPKITKAHGRPIYHDVAKDCGLNVKLHDIHSNLWRIVWELYVRCNHVTTSKNLAIAKLVETIDDHYVATASSG